MGEVKEFERAIIMTPHSITALLGGTKTQTRRLVDTRRLAVATSEETRAEDCGLRPVPRLPAGRHRVSLNPQGAVFVKDPVFGLKPGEFNFCCPYLRGKTELVRRNFDRGCWTITPWRTTEPSRLWVKERWDYFGGDEYLYQRDPAAVLYFERDAHTGDHLQRKWRTPLFMPRWASRMTLEVVEARLQRLQDISEDDAIAEGARQWPDVPDPHSCGQGSRWSMGAPTSTEQCLGTARLAYANAWDRLNAKRAAWASNPWVWAITYRRTNV